MSKIKLAVQDITPRADGSTEELRSVRINIIDEESTAAEEVNVYTNPESILMEPDSDKNILDHIDDRTIYNNNTPIPTDIGGIKKGETFNNVPIPTLLDSLLYSDNSSREVELSCDLDTDKAYEIGVSIAPITFTIHYTYSSSILYIRLTMNDYVVGAFTLNGTGESSYTYNGVVDSNSRFGLQVVDSDNNTIVYQNLINFTFTNPIYYGTVDPNTILSEAAIRSTLNKAIIKDDVSGRELLGSISCENKTIVVCIKPTLSTSLKYIDADGININSIFTKSQLGVQVTTGNNVLYDIYRSDDSSPYTLDNLKLYINI